MPWEGSELWVASFGDARLSGERLVAGGPAEAIVQPEWSPDGVLHFSSDRTGWWNLYRGDYEPVTALEAEIGGPLWVFGESWYAFLPDGRIVCAVFSDGPRPARGDRALGRAALRRARADPDRRPHDRRRARAVRRRLPHAPAVRRTPPTSQTGALEVLSADGEELVDAAYVSVPRPLEYPTTGGRTAHALFYPPAQPGLPRARRASARR